MIQQAPFPPAKAPRSKVMSMIFMKISKKLVTKPSRAKRDFDFRMIVYNTPDYFDTWTLDMYRGGSVMSAYVLELICTR